MRKKFRQKRKALYSSIYIPKASIILLDENNSAILKQKKKIDKLDDEFSYDISSNININIV